MTPLLRLARLPLFAVALVASLSAALGGCATDCKEVDGKTVCETETLQGYRGSTIALPTQGYTPGIAQRLRISVLGGNVRIGKDAQASITVVGGAPAGQITAVCVPIIALKADQEAEAIEQMKNNVTCTAETQNGEIVINVFRDGSRDSSLSAQLLIGVPDDFSGPITALTEHGDISLAGVRGPIDAQVTKGIGNVGVTPGGPILATDPGNIYTNFGDVQLGIPAGSVLTVNAQVDSLGEIINNTGVAAEAGGTSQAQTFVVAPGGQGWTLRSDSGKAEIHNQ